MSIPEAHTPSGRVRAIRAATDVVQARTRQVAVTTAAVVGGTVLATTTGSRFALAVAMAAFVVTCALAVADFMARDNRRLLLLYLIAEGYEDDNHPLIVRERRRLLVHTHRRQLARSIRTMAAERPADHFVNLRRPGQAEFGLHQAPSEVAVVATALEQPDLCRARGVAMAELLIVRGTISEDCRGDAMTVAADLGRVRYALLSS
jgi:hypothetical protein